MAPSKNKRAANAKAKSILVPLPIPVNTSQPPILPITAGTEVWNIVEIRNQILSYVDDLKDLASMLRTRKDGMGLVVGKLYYQMDYRRVRSNTVSASQPRRDLYLNAVTVIDARGLSLTRTMINKLRLGSAPPSELELDSHSGSVTTNYRTEATQKRVSLWLESYRPQLLDILIPSLRKRCPGLEQIIFGQTYKPFGPANWVVSLNPNKHHSVRVSKRVAAKGRGITDRIGSDNASIAQVTHFRTITMALMDAPASKEKIIRLLPRPTTNYGIRTSRFDLRIEPEVRQNRSVVYRQQWLRALNDFLIFGDLYKAIDFDDLPISFDLVRLIVQRPIDAGYTQTLERVVASHIQLDSLTSFASLASTSLTSLIIAAPTPPHISWNPSTARFSLLDIPGLSVAIRRHLSSLLHFEFALQDLSVERICRDILSADTLSLHGSISRLRVHMTRLPIVPFNLIRCLSAMVTKDASIEILGFLDETGCHSTFHRYLQSQTEERRRYLSTVQFPVLGINTLDAVSTLSYNTDHCPRHVLSTHLDSLSIPAVLNTTAPPSALQSAMSRLSDATRLLVTHPMLASAANASDLIPSAINKMVLDTYRQVKRQEGAISDIGREMAGSEEVQAMVLKAAGIAKTLRREVKAIWVEVTGGV